MRTAADRNLDAETRAVEEGHRAYVVEGGAVEVVSDSYAGKRYRVEFVALGDRAIQFSCRPVGRQAYRDDHLAACTTAGIVPCKHAAVAARRLEREGLAVLDPESGLWLASDLAVRIHEDHTAALIAAGPADPFEGL